MTSGYLKRTCVRVVLFAHLMQIFTPALHASDTDYQYRLKIKTLDLDSEKYRVEVSRRKNDVSEEAQVLQRLDMEAGKIKDHFIRHAPEGQDALYSKFSAAVVRTYEAGHNVRFVYDIPGFGQIQMMKGGKAFFTQDENNTSLSNYDLAVKSTGDLLISHLRTAGLALNSLKTELDGNIVTECLEIKHEAVNRGKISGDDLIFDVKGKLINEGSVALNLLCGDGLFINHRELNLIGNAPFLIIRHFLNETKTIDRPAILTGHKATIGNTNEWLINDVNSHVLVDNLSFHGAFGTGYSAAENNRDVLTQKITNRGNIKSTILDLSHCVFDNSGSMKTASFEVYDSNWYNYGNGTLHVHGPAGGLFTARESVIQNNGELIVSSGKQGKSYFTQESGQFLNKGTWEHTGDVTFGTDKSFAQLINSGFLRWQDGQVKLYYQAENTGYWALNRISLPSKRPGPVSFATHLVNSMLEIKNSGTVSVKDSSFYKQPVLVGAGELVLDGVSCSEPIDIPHNGTLRLVNSKLDITTLNPNPITPGLNSRIIELYSGQYTISEFFDLKLIRFLGNDWTLTNDKGNTDPHRLVLTGGRALGLEAIESQKKLNYDIRGMPKSITANKGVHFSKRHKNHFTLADLKKINTPGKVVFFLSDVNTSKKHKLPNIGHLDLTVDGDCEIYRPFLVPTLTLNVKGELTCGSDKRLATIAGTKGPLTVNAHSIDGKYAKFYGKGGATLKSSRGDIIVGTEARGVDESIKEQYIKALQQLCGGMSMFLPNMIASLDYSLNISNGAYVASGGKTFLQSAGDILINFGTVSSVLGNRLNALKNVQNMGGKISSQGGTIIEASAYNHLRKPAVDKGNGYEYPGSGPAILESLGKIEFFVKNIRNLASSIRCGRGIFVNKIPGLNKETGYVEELQHFYYRYFNEHGRGGDWGWKGILMLTQSCVTQSGDVIKMNLGDFVVTGSMSAGEIVIEGTGKGLFHNSSRSRQTLNPTEPRFANVTEYVQDQAQRPGFLRLNKRGAVKSEFPLGTPSMTEDGNVVLLANPQLQTIRQIPFNLSRIFNPLSSINLDLHIQSLMANLAGKVHVKGGRGNNLSLKLWNNAGKWRQQNNKAVMDQADLSSISDSMLLTQVVQSGSEYQQQTILCVAPNDINPWQDQGDVVADESIEIGTVGEQTHQNNRIVARGLKGITLTSTGGRAKLETQSYAVSHETKESHVIQQFAMPQQQLLAPAGPINVTAHDDIIRTGSHMEAGGDIDKYSETGSLIENPLLLPTFIETRRESRGFLSSSESRETTLTHSALPNTTISGSNLRNKAGEGIHAVAPQDYAEGEIHYDSPDTVIEGLIALNRHTSESTKSNGFTEQSTSKMQESAFGLAANLVAKKGVRFSGKAKVNANITAPEIHDETDSGIKFVSKVVEVLSSGQSITDSPLCSVDAGFKAGYETMIPCMLMVEKIIRSKEGGEMLFESVLMDERAEIIGKFVKTTYELKQWQTSWCHVKQVVPNEIIIAAAIAITILTKGAGAKVMAPLLKGVTAATGMALSATGVVMVNAGFSAFCAAATSGFLRSGDPLQVAGQMVSLEQLKSIGITMASAGLCSQLGGMLDVNMEPGIKDLSMHLKEHALRTTVDTVLNVAINHAPVDEALTDAVKQIPLKAVAAYAANQICCNINEPMGVKAAHTILGGLAGFAMEGNRDGLVAGATGALAAQVVGDILMSDAHAITGTAIKNLNEDGKPLTPENLKAAIGAEVARKADLAKIAAVSVTALLKKDPNVALFTASNVMDNDITVRQSIYVIAELQKLLQAAAMAEAAKRFEEERQEATQEVDKAMHAQPPTGDKEKVEAKDTTTNQETAEDAEAVNIANDTLLSNLLHGYKDIIWQVVCEKSGGCEVSAEEKVHALKKEAFPTTTETFGVIDETVHLLHEMEHDQDEIIKSSKSSLFDKLIALVQKFSFKHAFEEIALPSAKVQIPTEVAMHLTINQAEISSILSSVINNKPIDQQAWDQVSASVNELGDLVRSRHIIEHKIGPHAGHGHGHGKK